MPIPAGHKGHAHTAEGYSRGSSVRDTVLIPAERISYAYYAEGYREGPVFWASSSCRARRSCRIYGCGRQGTIYKSCKEGYMSFSASA